MYSNQNLCWMTPDENRTFVCSLVRFLLICQIHTQILSIIGLNIPKLEESIVLQFYNAQINGSKRPRDADLGARTNLQIKEFGEEIVYRDALHIKSNMQNLVQLDKVIYRVILSPKNVIQRKKTRTDLEKEANIFATEKLCL